MRKVKLLSILTVGVVSASLILFACTKEKITTFPETLANNQTPNANGLIGIPVPQIRNSMLYFEKYDDYSRTVDLLSVMSEPLRISWEQTNDFVSLRAFSQQASLVIPERADLLQNILNSDGMLQIEDYIVKIDFDSEAMKILKVENETTSNLNDLINNAPNTAIDIVLFSNGDFETYAGFRVGCSESARSSQGRECVSPPITYGTGGATYRAYQYWGYVNNGVHHYMDVKTSLQFYYNGSWKLAEGGYQPPNYTITIREFYNDRKPKCKGHESTYILTRSQTSNNTSERIYSRTRGLHKWKCQGWVELTINGSPVAKGDWTEWKVNY